MSKPIRTLFAIVGIFVILFAVPQSYAQQQDEITVMEWDVPTPNSAPHDIVVDDNGIVWYTAIGSNKIGSFDPTAEQFQEFDIPTPSSRPHGLVPDEDDNIWFTEQSASQIGKLDAATGVIEEFPTPTPGSSPYGIILDEDGNPWYAALRAHRIGMVDADTGEITEYPTPTDNSGTRRIAIDSGGKLWFTEYNVGKIGSFDPATGEFQEYDTESSSSGPYAIWVDIYDNMWFSMTNAHKMGRFDQSTDTLHEYDMPTPQTTSRFIYTDSEGRVWFPNDVNNKIGVITLEREDSTAQSQELAGELVITEVELSPPDMGDGAIWVEVHNPTDETFSTPVDIRTSEGFSFLESSAAFQPGEYKLFEVWDASEPENYPTENAVVELHTDAEEAHRTSPLTDTFTDSRTWQLNGTEWEFVEATPTRAIPEFGSIALIVIAAGTAGAIFARKFMIGQ